MATERSAKEYRDDVNAAIAGTEGEIFTEAMGDDEQDNDGDRSLEEMGDGLEGDHLDDEDEAEEASDEEATEEESEEASEEESEEEESEEADEEEAAEEEPEAQPEPVTAKDRADQRIPRSRLNQEIERRRAAEAEKNALSEQIKALNSRLDTTLTQIASARQQPQPQPQTESQPEPEPDQFVDPQGHTKWVIAQAEKRAEAKIQESIAAYQQQQQAQQMQRVNENLAAAAQGPRAWEFAPAYQRLSATLQELDRNKDPSAQAIRFNVFNSPDPAQAIFEWWENNGGAEYRESIADQLGYQVRPKQQAQPRHEVRVPSSLRTTRSLNSVGGSQRQAIADPEMLEDSEDAIFRSAFK